MNKEVKKILEKEFDYDFKSEFYTDEILLMIEEVIKATTLQLLQTAVSESTLGIPDIRNKLSPITHLISMVEMNEPDFVRKAIPQAKESVNYLAQREVYSR